MVMVNKKRMLTYTKGDIPPSSPSWMKLTLACPSPPSVPSSVFIILPPLWPSQALLIKAMHKIMHPEKNINTSNTKITSGRGGVVGGGGGEHSSPDVCVHGVQKFVQFCLLLLKQFPTHLSQRSNSTQFTKKYTPKTRTSKTLFCSCSYSLSQKYYFTNLTEILLNCIYIYMLVIIVKQLRHNNSWCWILGWKVIRVWHLPWTKIWFGTLLHSFKEEGWFPTEAVVFLTVSKYGEEDNAQLTQGREDSTM